MSPRDTLFWTACGLACCSGTLLAISVFSSHSQAYVQIRPAALIHSTPLTARPHQRLNPVQPSNPPSTALSVGDGPTVEVLTAEVYLLSATSVLLSFVAIFISLTKKQQSALRDGPLAPLINILSLPQEANNAPLPSEEADFTTEQSDSSSTWYYPPAEPSRTTPIRIDEVAVALKEEQARRKNLSPRQVILELQQGNARFWSGAPERPELRAVERRALVIGQAPSVCILSCSDSRVPVEILFDQGLGNVFVVRVAGNILDNTTTGSIEFAVKYLGVKVLLVMGHEGCGAVKGAMTFSNEDLDAQPVYLQSVLKKIKNNLNVPILSKIRDSRAQDREAIIVNTSTQVKILQENALIAQKVAEGNLLVCGAFYEITSGIVDFFTLDKNGLVTDV